MPRYHFHLVDGHQLTDIKGVELSDDIAARKHAEQMADSFGQPYRAIRVVGSDGGEIFRVNMSDRKGD